MFPDGRHEADLLFDGFEQVQPSPLASARAVERARQALLSHARRIGPPVPAGVAWTRNFSFLVGAAALVGIVSLLIAMRIDHTSDDRNIVRSMPDSNRQSSGLPLAAKRVPGIQVFVAENGPILVANGGSEPISLGATVPTRSIGNALHVWNWGRSLMSRIIPGVEFSADTRAGLSADGRFLVFARGQYVDLATGELALIDLGRENVEIQGAIYGRIGGIQFSPDGKSLALRVTNFDEQRPGLIQSEVIQIIEFPSGERLCEIPAGRSQAETISFSPDGQKVVIVSAENQLVSHDVTTGQPLRHYEPKLESQVLAIAHSPDGRILAASLRNGDILIWNIDSDRLVRQIDFERFRERGGAVVFGGLRFAPDSRHLAAEYWNETFVVDATTGTIAGEIHDRIFRHFQWSRDRKLLTGVTPVMSGESSEGDQDEVYPAVHEWDWRKGRLVRSIALPEPTP